jgi:hypothetical protein
MVKIEIDNIELDDTDKKMVAAVNQSIELYPNETLDEHWDTFKQCNSRNHIVGRGGNHIWFSKKDAAKTRILKILGNKNESY